MIHHVKGCQEDTSFDHSILHHGTNNLKSNNAPEKVVHEIVDVAASVKPNKNQFWSIYKKK